MTPKPRIAPAPEPVAEPILVDLPTGAVVVGPDDSAWPIAWAWREKDAALQAAEKDLRVKRAQITRLQDDQDAKRRSYHRRETIERLFGIWQQLRRHPRSKLTPERFDAARARLEDDYTELDMTMALYGQAAHPVQKGGVVYDDFELVFRSGKQVERYANLCPPEQRRHLRAAPGEQQALPGA